MTEKELRKKAMALPQSPGVYIMKNKDKKIIYIGKAKALKNRVSSYFGSHSNHSLKVIKMVESVDDFDYILCDTEFEALVLECSLIKQHMPKYNILLKDDKGYNYIKVTKEEFPRIKECYRMDDDNAEYIGPFISTFSVKKAVEETRKIFRLPSCNKKFPRDYGKSRPCLNWSIGACSAPCAGRITLEAHNENVENALKNGFDLITKNLLAILGTVGALGGKLVNWAIGLILSIYFLIGKKGLLTGVNNLRRTALLPETFDRHTVFLRRCNHIFLQYIGCNLLDALIVGAANAVFMTVFQMPYVPLVSFVVGITNLLPTFGPFIGAGVGSIILVLHKPILALWFLIFTTVLQTVDGYLVKPRLFSSSLGIPAVWTLIAIILGGKFFGIFGVLLATPTAAVLTFLYKDNFLPWLSRRKKGSDPAR